MIFALVLFGFGFVVSIRRFDIVTYTWHGLKGSYFWRGECRTLWEWRKKTAMELYAMDKKTS